MQRARPAGLLAKSAMELCKRNSGARQPKYVNEIILVDALVVTAHVPGIAE